MEDLVRFDDERETVGQGTVLCLEGRTPEGAKVFSGVTWAPIEGRHAPPGGR